MSSVIINGRKYDPVTGLPLESESKDSQEKVTNETTQSISRFHHASEIHTPHPKSETLNRKAVRHSKHAIIKHQTKAKKTPTAQHSDVHRFAPHPIGVLKPRKIMDISSPSQPHPSVIKAYAHSAAKEHASSSQPPSASVIKNEALKKAVNNAQTQQPIDRAQPKSRITAWVSATFAVLVFGAYLTYLNMPALSVRIAAAQAGINATYPEYRPTGYSLNGPVTYADGRVAMTFKSNGGSQEFTIKQTKSAWNSDAVLDNYVTPRAGTTYIPYTERGLTIYTYDNNAAWVNGGVLYTIEGDAPLSSEQIRRIATSLL